MGYLALLGLVLSGAGTLASILGIFFAIYARQNGRMTRDLIQRMHEHTQGLIMEMRDEFSKHLVKMDEHNNERHKDTQRLIKELIKEMDEHNNERHKEMMTLLARLVPPPS